MFSLLMMESRMVIRHRLPLLVLFALFLTSANAGGMGSGDWLALGGNCLVGSRGVKPCAPGLICLLSKPGRPEVDVPHSGMCNQPTVPKCYQASTGTSWAPGARVPAGDSCNYCVCNNAGKFICTSIQVFRCIDSPCRLNQCPLYPTATCKANYCGGCKADFYVQGKKVNCTMKSPPALPPRVGRGGVCTIGSLTDNLRICAAGLVCLLTKQGKPEVDVPNVGTCQPVTAPKCRDTETSTFWAPGTNLKKPNCVRCYCPEMRNFTFSCGPAPVCDLLRNPCQNARCFGYPTAKCRLEPCSQCTAEWYTPDGTVVECKTPPPRPPPVGENGNCTVGTRTPKSCASGLVCVLNKQGKPESGAPHQGICRRRTAPMCQDPGTKLWWSPLTNIDKPTCLKCFCQETAPNTRKYAFICNRAPMCSFIRDPCEGATCRGYPTAKCRLDTCTACTTEWYIGNRIVTCQPPATTPTRIALNGTCLVGTRGARQCAAGLICLLSKKGQPEVDRPNVGTCQRANAPKCLDSNGSPWAPGTTFRADACNTCNCPRGGGGLQCTKVAVCRDQNPCLGKSCPAYPAAQCVPSLCGTCGHAFFLNKQPVNCDLPNVIPENGPCFLGSRRPVPCAPGLTCWLQEGGKPWIDAANTGVCKDLKKVKFCREQNSDYIWAPDSVHETLPCGSCKCPAGGGSLSCQKVLTNCLVDPCMNAKCPLNPGAQCRQNYCGGCLTDFFLNGKKVDCY